MQIRVYNDFKRRLLNGEVSADFPCKAILLNSAFDNMYDYAAYFRDNNDFNSYSSYSLIKRALTNTYEGRLLATGKVLETTYYRDTDLNEEDADSADLMIVTSANSATYKPMYARGEDWQNARFEDYIKHYGYFYLVARADDFHALVGRAQSLDLEKFVVVLADNIEHLDVDSSCFGCSREHPFRGVFDGNGYALCLNTMKIGSRSNGIFGYISDEGIVRNLIISADTTNIDETDSEILVSNTEQISLQTLKNGSGDVKFGILAGTNDGTVENVLIDAKLKYNCEFTPSFCFVQNKSDYPTEFIGNNWKQISATDMTDVTALSSFENICFPTPLCLNSEANMIPYVGYFNEGSFNQETVSFQAKYNNPLYYTNTKTRTDYSTSYFADIYDLYKLKGDKYHAVENYLELIGDASPDMPNGIMSEHSTALSFRLGPNNKEAYLLGGMFGLNNGNVKNCVCDVQMTFNDNFVALVGGLAGRGARGNIADVSTRAKFVGTSGIYTHDYQLVNDKKTNVLASAVLEVQQYARHAYPNSLIGEISASKITRFTWNPDSRKATEIVYNWGDLLSASINGASADRLDFDTRGTLTLIGSGYQLTETESHQTDVDIAGKDVCLIYNYDVKDAFLPPSGNNLPVTFFTTLVRGTYDEQEGPRDIRFDGPLDNFDIPLNQSLSTYSLYAISSRTTNGIKLLTSQTNLLLASAAANSHVNINQNNKISIQDLIVITEFSNFNSNDHNPYGAISGTAKFNLSGYNVYIDYDTTSTADVRALTTMQEYDNMNLRLAPVYNMGGMFGEYVYSNAQSVSGSLVCAEARGFKWPVNDPLRTRGFGHFNNISHFASNIIIDSSNKSNSDVLLDSFALSANARVRNDLKFNVANILDGEPIIGGGFRPVNAAVSAVIDSDDCTSAIHTFNTLNIYNQIMPGVVTTNYTDHDDEDIDDDDNTAPNLGITWLDQLFYSYGINMGYNGIPGNADAEVYELPYKQYNNPSACSGWYINFPAQGQVFDGVNFREDRSPITANTKTNVYDRNLWKYDTIFNSVYNLESYGLWPAESTDTGGILVTKQLTAYPNHYPLYRGRASITDRNKLTYAQSAYLRIPAEGMMTAYSAIDNRKSALITQSNDLHKNVVTDSYIYEYSQSVYSNTLPQLDAHVYNLFGTLTSCVTKTEVENVYVISSNSHESVYKKNGYADISMNSDVCDIDIPADGLPVRWEIDTGTASMTEGATGAILHFNISMPILGAEKPEIYVRSGSEAKCSWHYRDDSDTPTYYPMYPDVRATEVATVYEDTLYITYPFTLPDSHVADDWSLFVPMLIKYTLNGEEQTSYPYLRIPFNHAELNSDFKFKLDTTTRADSALSANTLCFGFVPTEEDIISGLNLHDKVYARTLSSDDISYMLLLDEQSRPIVDIKLDTTAVASAGLYIEFESLRKYPYLTTQSSGMLINITK